MNLLMLDTSGPVCGVAILRDDRLACEMCFTGARTHSAQLMPLVEQALSFCGMTLSEMDAFGAVAGPGSFTGIRIGVSAAKAFAAAHHKPCLGVDALEALAANCTAFEGIVCSIIDARVGQAYTARFRAGMPPLRLSQDGIVRMEDELDALAALGEPLLFLGDGVETLGGLIRERLGDQAHFAAQQHCGLRPASALMLARERWEELSDGAHSPTLEPIYLRASQAERERHPDG